MNITGAEAKYSCACNNFNVFLSVAVMQWKDAQPSDLMDSKLRCMFEMPEQPVYGVGGDTALPTCFTSYSVTIAIFS